MILTGARWDAATALRHGLVSEVWPSAELLPAAHKMAERILRLGPLAVRLAKAALNASSQMPLSAGLAFESTVQAITFESADKQEGTAAFLEKRRPDVPGGIESMRNFGILALVLGILGFRLRGRPGQPPGAVAAPASPPWNRCPTPRAAGRSPASPSRVSPASAS